MPRGGARLRGPQGRKNEVGGRVKQRRAELHITQDVLIARLADVTGGQWNPAPKEIARIETYTRQVIDQEILALARALEADPCWLLLGEPTSEGGSSSQAAGEAAVGAAVPLSGGSGDPIRG